jgi:predicted nucleic acid-binding protein
MKRGPVLERLDLRSAGEAKDRNDAFLLAMAAEGDADYLVTGDKRAGLLELAHIGRARIVTQYIFCAEVLS